MMGSQSRLLPSFSRSVSPFDGRSEEEDFFKDCKNDLFLLHMRLGTFSQKKSTVFARGLIKEREQEIKSCLGAVDTVEKVLDRYKFKNSQNATVKLAQRLGMLELVSSKVQELQDRVMKKHKSHDNNNNGNNGNHRLALRENDAKMRCCGTGLSSFLSMTDLLERQEQTIRKMASGKVVHLEPLHKGQEKQEVEEEANKVVSKQNAKLKKKLAEVESELKKLSQVCSSLKGKLAERDEQLVEKEKQLAEQNAQFAEQTEKMVDKDKRFAEQLAAKTALLQDDRDRLDVDRKKLRHQVDNIEKLLEKERTKHAEKVELERKVRKEVEQKLVESQQNNQRLEITAEQLRNDLLQETQLKSGVIARLEEEKTVRVQSEIESSKHENLAVETKKALQEMGNCTDELRERVKSLEENLRVAESEKQHIDQLAQKKVEEIHVLRQTAEQRVRELESQLRETGSSLEESKNQVELLVEQQEQMRQRCGEDDDFEFVLKEEMRMMKVTYEKRMQAWQQQLSKMSKDHRTEIEKMVEEYDRAMFQADLEIRKLKARLH